MNCRVYNGVESPVGQMGVRVHTEYSNLLKTFNLVERFSDENQPNKFVLDETCFDDKPALNHGEKEEISDSELPKDSIRRMNEKNEERHLPEDQQA